MKFITVAHGSGGEETRKLIEEVFLREFSDPVLTDLEDSALLDVPRRIAFTTDGFTVSPIFFRGGDIGKLAVSGTVNDLAVTGAKPIFMSVSFIIEEGFPLEDLKRIVRSMKETAEEVSLRIVAGDTKVVPKGQVDGVFITTSGIGEVLRNGLSSRNLQPGDLILVSGTVGDHGATVIAEREGINMDMDLESDCSPLWDLIEPLLKELKTLRAMRDPTRGGLAAVLNEWADASQVQIEVDEERIPVKDQVRGICEMLGFEPTHLANEGMVVVCVGQDEGEKALDLLRKHPKGKDAAIVGSVVSKGKGRVVLKTPYGAERILDPPSGELLPRIC